MTQPPVPQSMSRRIGNRAAVGAVDGHVLVETKRRRQVVAEWVPVTVEDASMTGMGFVGELPPSVQLDAVVPFALNGIQARVHVVRIADLLGRPAKRYGVEFAETGSPILDEIHRIVHGNESEERDDIWRYGSVD